MDQRRLGINLVLVALAFLSVFHTVFGLLFGTGLAQVSALAAVGFVGLLVVVNVGVSEEGNP
ncbi:MAG: hypothetical protein ABEJ06_01390 [Haloarculaceae archaeon]